jgi:hypothetical protein
MSDFELVSPLKPDECANRLQKVTDHWFVSKFGSRQVISAIHGRDVSLRKRIAYHNAFQTYLIGSLMENEQGTVFRGTAGMHPFLIVFLAICSGLTLLGCLAFTGQNLLAGRGFPFQLVGVPFVAALILCVIHICRWLARDEEQYLVNFVVSVIGAKPAPASSVSTHVVSASDRTAQEPVADQGIIPGTRR